MRLVAAATCSLVALMAADPAKAQCVTSTTASTTTITCGDTTTVDATNSNGNNPSTSANFQSFSTAIDARIEAGRTVNGYGLLLNGTGANGISVTNDGIISNTSGTADQAIAGGLRIVGASGPLTYMGSGNVTTTFTGPPPAGAAPVAALGLESDSGSITLGSAAAPVTGTFRGPAAISLSTFGGSDINAFISGGLLDATFSSSLAIAGRGNMNLVMTGNTIMTGSLNVSNWGGAPGAFSIDVATDARIGTAAAPVRDAINIAIGGTTGGTTTLSLTGTAAIFGNGNAVLLDRSPTAPGAIQLTTAAGTTISATGAPAFGINIQGQGSGAIDVDLAGSITSTLGGLYIVTGDGATTVTIREGAIVSGNVNALDIRRAFGATGASDILVLGTLTSPNMAATFDGTLRIGNGGTSGSLSGNVINDGSLIFNRSDAISYAGIISGSGGLIKQGGGTLTLTGASTFTGATNVSAGTLLVNGSLTGGVTVANGATLGGTGSVGATAVNGTLSPGGSGAISTLTINGNLVFNAGSTFRVDLGAGTNDRVNVTGTATLAGSVAAFASGTVFTVGTYTLLNAAGGISGTFSPLTTTPNAVAQLAYDGNNVYLEVTVAPTDTFVMSTRDALVFNAPTVTTNRIDVFSTQIIGRLTGGQPLYDQIFAAAYNSPIVQNALIAARAAITGAGGPGVIIGDPVRTSSSTTSVTSSNSTYSLAGPGVQTVNTVTTFGPATVQIGALSTCDVSMLPSATRPSCTTGGTSYSVGDDETNFNTTITTTYTIDETRTDTITDTLRETWEISGQVVAVGSIHAEVQSGLFDLSSRLLNRLTGPLPANAGWGEVYAFRVSQTGRRDARGFAAGANLALAPGLTLAFGLDHGSLDIDVPGAEETGEVTLTEFGAGLRLERGPFTAALSATYGGGNAETLRTIVGGSGADYDVRVAGVAFELGYAFAAAGWTLRPVAGLDYVSVRTDGFTETDMLGLVVGRQNAERVRASLGLEASRRWGAFELAASARYLSVLDGDERIIPVAFAVAPGRALDMTAPSEPDTALLGARGRFALSPAVSLWLAYDGRFGSGYTSHAGTAGLSVSW
ncbi:MAG TPA: autotransporter domain-containing protein [Allosphingosinicella sp.]|nr:autotransporter domain-containing protein [Allosphingosinicella sp.]